MSSAKRALSNTPNNMAVEHVAYYNQHGEYVGYGDHQDGQEAGHYTKNVFAFLLRLPGLGDDKGGVILSVRSPQKQHYGGLIEESAGGTVRLLDAETGLTETPFEAGQREIEEEIGVRLLGRLVIIHSFTHAFPGRGKDGLRRHHTALLLGATDTPLSDAVLQQEEIDRLLLFRNEAELQALDRSLCIPSMDEEFGHLLTFLRRYSGDEDAIEWATNNWYELSAEAEPQS